MKLDSAIIHKISTVICASVFIIAILIIKKTTSIEIPQPDLTPPKIESINLKKVATNIDSITESWKKTQYPRSQIKKGKLLRTIFAYHVEKKMEFWPCQNCGAENPHSSIICNNCGWLNTDLNVDSDNDGMSDYWEIDNKLDAQDPDDAHLDPDNDGRNNLQEFRDDTDPWIKDSKDDTKVRATNVNLPFSLIKTYQKPVKILFMGYIKNIKGEYSVQINWAGKTDFYNLGNLVRGYVIKDFQKIIEEQAMPSGVIVDHDKSFIVCQKKKFPSKTFYKKKYVTENDVFAKITFNGSFEVQEVHIDSIVKDIVTATPYVITDITLSPPKIIVEDEAKKTYTLLIKESFYD